jgi:uncharacterized protein DUF4399/uncharacterized protein DUF3551
MRQLLTACSLVIVATVSLATSQSAHAAPWCSTYGGMSCGYYTFDQCMQSIRGVGGNCVQNPRESGGSAGGGAAGRRGRSWGDQDETQQSKRRQDDRKARQEEAQKARQEEERRDRQEEARKARLEEERKARQEERKAKEQEETKPAKPVETAAPKPAPVPAAPAVTAPAQPTPAAVMPNGMPRKPAPADARVYFVGLQNGAEVSSEVTLRFGVVNMGVAPAGLDNPNTGHHHLLIDTALPALDQPIPSDFNHLHFGAGQTEAVLTLPPGKHKLQLLFADDNHVPHNPAVMSDVIEVIVKAKK